MNPALSRTGSPLTRTDPPRWPTRTNPPRPLLVSVRAPSVHQSLREYGRGIAGGLLFSLPLLFTMEMWDMGVVAEPWRLLVGIGGAFLLLLGYNRHAGLRCDASLSEVIIDSVEELGLGLLLAAGLLWMIGSIDGDTRLPELMGKVVIEALAVAIGVSVGTAQLGGESHGLADDQPGATPLGASKVERPSASRGDARCAEAEEEADRHGPSWLFGQLNLAACGAVLVAANIAPTEEIGDIARGLGSGQLLGLTALTLAIGSLVLYLSDFRGASDHVHHRTRLDVVFGTLATYLVSMIAAATLLWFFGRFADSGISFCLAQTIVLGLPTAIGASAGRLLLQQQ